MRTSTSLYLLAYLCRRRGEVRARDSVAGTLWPESGESRARGNLRQALHHLRQVLEPRADGEVAYLDVRRQAIGLRADAPLWVDVEAFERHLRAAEDGDDATAGHQLESAIALYRGPFLETCDVDWCIEEREFLKARYVEALDRVLRLAVRRTAYPDAIEHARRILELNPLREDVHRHLMELYYRTGDRAAALRQFGRCRRRLEDDLGATPEPATERLLQIIEANSPLDNAEWGRTETSPTNVPHPLTRFVGRHQETEALVEELEGARLVTLTGVGGSGKTRLAIEVGHRLGERYPGGVWFVDLAPLTDPHWVPQAIASTLKIPQTKIQAVTEELIEHFQTGRAALVLDNCEHLVDACARLARRLLEGCPELTILTTSREPLRLAGERIWPVDPLPVPDAPSALDDLKDFAIVQMFLDRARSYRPDFRLTEADIDDVAAICQASEGIPLAIELTASWLRLLTPSEIADRLASGVEFLSARTRDVSARHRSMRAVFEHSWTLLSDRNREVFQRLSVFRGGFTRRAAEEVAGASSMRLSALLDKSLLFRADDGRYAIHEVLRQFGEAELHASAEAEAILQRHLAFFLDLAETAESHWSSEAQSRWLRRLTAEQDNLWVAMSWALESNRVEEALRMAGALGRFWSLRGHLTEGRQWLDLALERRDEAPLDVQAKAFHQAGELAWRQGDYASTEAFQTESLARYRQLGDQGGISQALVGLGRVAHEQGRLREATELFSESLAIARELDDRRGTAVALANLGEVRLEQDDPQGAREDLQRGLDILRALGDRVSACTVLNNLGYVASVQGDVDSARDYLNESLSIGRELDDKRGMAMALGNLGNLALEEGDWDRADAALSEVAGIFAEMRDRRNRSVALNKLGQVALERQEIDCARDRLVESLEICREMDDPLATAEVLCGLAEVLRRNDHPAEAARLQGAVDAALASIGASLQGYDRRLFERTAATLQTTMGEADYQDAFERGREDALEAAIERVQATL